MSPSSVTRGVMSMFTPTSLILVRAQRVDAGAAGRDRRVAGRDHRDLSPSFSVSFVPSAPRSCGLAISLVFVSLSRNRTIAVGTAR